MAHVAGEARLSRETRHSPGLSYRDQQDGGQNIFPKRLHGIPFVANTTKRCFRDPRYLISEAGFAEPRCTELLI